MWNCGSQDPPPLQSPTFVAGDFSEGRQSPDGKMLLSKGLSCKVLARTGTNVPFANGQTSSMPFHDGPDGAGVIPKAGGGYYLMSNSEASEPGKGWWQSGVGVLEFNGNGEVVGYDKVADTLRRPCSGATTPWGSWIACEEVEGGEVWQVSPTGRLEKTSMGALGYYETWAWFYNDQEDQFYAFATRDEARRC